MDLIVSYSPAGPVLDWGAGPRRCAIGPAGIARKSSEGDGITPSGVFPLREVFYRADRVAKARHHPAAVAHRRRMTAGAMRPTIPITTGW